MNWKEFKAEVERQGVTEESEINWIDISVYSVSDIEVVKDMDGIVSISSGW